MYVYKCSLLSEGRKKDEGWRMKEDGRRMKDYTTFKVDISELGSNGVVADNHKAIITGKRGGWDVLEYDSR